MRGRCSETSTYYTTPEFQGLSVPERVELLEKLLPRPATAEEAFKRASIGLYAIGEASTMLHDQLVEEMEYSNKAPLQFWTEIVADTEARFQGNINSVLLKKHFTQVKLATPCFDDDE